MMTESENLALAAAFPPATREQWRKLVDAVLKGAPFERLASTTYDGLKIEPLAPRRADAQPVPGRGPAVPWQILQRIEHPAPDAANAQALHDLANGASGLALVFAGAVGAYGHGIDASAETIARVLDGVHLDAGIALELDLLPRAKDAAGHVAALVERRGLSPAATNIRFGFDPLGAMAASGRSPLPWREIAPLFARLIADLAARGFDGPFAAADGRVVHNAGGSEAQELAFVLAVALTYLRALKASGVALDAARKMIFFRLAADADQFLTIAKFRALRKTWACVEAACGLAPAPAFISAETAWRTMTQRDPYVNMLRATIAVFSAGLGGADAVSVLPFTAALGLPDRLARRIARNTQLILIEESNLFRVADPAAGAGAVEDLTEKLCRATWELLQEIERTGGAADALADGVIGRNVAETRAAREQAVARRKDALTGTSEFPDLAEAAIHSPSPLVGEGQGSRGQGNASASPQGGGQQAKPGTSIAFEPLRPFRLAEPFERLRDASDRVLAQTGARPKVFLANLGTLADFTARATFAKNFFEAGGIEAISNDGFSSRLPTGELKTDLAALVAAFKTSGAALACLCSADKVYEEEAAAAAQALKQAKAHHIYLAGRPGAREASERASGVQTFVYTGCDALAVLEAAHGLIVR